MTDAAPPSDRLEVTVGGEKRELFMSFALLNELVRVVGDIPYISQIEIDAELCAKVFGVLFGERDEKRKLKRPAEMEEIEISIADAQKVSAWVQGHLLDFFLAAVERAAAAARPFEARMKAVLTPSGAGSPASPGVTPSAGR